MTGPVRAVADLLAATLDLLTDDEEPLCTALTPAVCRVAVYLGGEVPWDSCDKDRCSDGGNGQLWAKIISIDPVTGTDQGGKCNAWNWTAEFGIVRCVAKPDNNGNPPSAVAVEADAFQQVLDADTIFTALTCCDTTSVDALRALQDVTVSRWNPVGPSGGCAGGTWTVRGRLDVCC